MYVTLGAAFLYGEFNGVDLRCKRALSEGLALSLLGSLRFLRGLRSSLIPTESPLSASINRNLWDKESASDVLQTSVCGGKGKKRKERVESS